MTQTVTLTTDIWIGGVLQSSGTAISVDSGLAGELVSSKRATYVTDPMGSGRTEQVRGTRDANGNLTALVVGSETIFSFIDVGGTAGNTVEV
jgi:hypothetical protein